MSASDEPEGDFMSVAEMREWFAQEQKDLDKARELRIKEATGFIEAYSRGELTPKEAMGRLIAYEDRWGEPLGVASAMPHVSDEEILAKMDKASKEADERSESFRRRVARAYFREL
jgi:hypothetical protein